MKKIMGILVMMLISLISFGQIKLWNDIYSKKERSNYEQWHIEIIFNKEYSRNFITDKEGIKGVIFESYRNYTPQFIYELISDLRKIESLLNKKYPEPMELLSPKISNKTLEYAEVGEKINISKRMFLDKLNIKGKSSFDGKHVNKISIEIYDRYMLNERN